MKGKSLPGTVSHQNLAQLAAETHYSAARLAVMRGVTSRTLQRHFRGNYDVSPQCCFDNLRDIEAWKLVQQEMPKNEIALRLGYKYASHLSRRLKKFRDAKPPPKGTKKN